MTLKGTCLVPRGHCLSPLMWRKNYLPLLEALECFLDWMCCLRARAGKPWLEGSGLPVFMFLGNKNGF